MHFQVFGNWAGGFAGCLSALDCRMVRQRRLTSSLRLARSPRKLLTLSRTEDLVPRHKFPVASSPAQPETASSAVKRLSGKLTAPEVSTYAKWRRSPGEGWRLSPLPQPSYQDKAASAPAHELEMPKLQPGFRCPEYRDCGGGGVAWR